MLATLVLVGSTAHAQHNVPYFPAASDEVRQGFVRVVNRSDADGPVTVRAIDDTGRDAGRISFTMAAGETVHFNSADLERGNPAKAITGAVGPGVGDWRLQLQSALDIEVLGYLRTTDGFLTSMHDVVAETSQGHRVPTFNPGSNRNQVSLLRVTNLGTAAATVSVAGVDGAGRPSAGELTMTIPVGASRTVDATELETGTPNAVGGLGDGEAKWQLLVVGSEPIRVMSLLESPEGHVTNLSTAPPNSRISPEDGLVHALPYIPAAADPNLEGFVRVINHSAEGGTVHVEAVDDAGNRRGPVPLTVSAAATVHFNSKDLEQGNSAKGLGRGVGPGEGDWRLELRSTLDVEVLSYLRTPSGFLTSMHDLAPTTAARHRIVVFNPGRNANQVSLLRLINPNAGAATAVVTGTDDRGLSRGDGATIRIPGGSSTTVSSRVLESGAGLDGEIGTGDGKWSLTVESDLPIHAMSLLSSPTGHVTNLSTPNHGDGDAASRALASVLPIVDVPAGVPDVAATDVSVSSLVSPQAEVLPTESATLLTAADDGGTLMLALANRFGGYLDEPAGRVRVDIDSTLVTLVGIASGYRVADIDQVVADAVQAHGDYAALRETFVGLMRVDKNYLDRLYDHGEAVESIKRIGVDVRSRLDAAKQSDGRGSTVFRRFDVHAQAFVPVPPVSVRSFGRSATGTPVEKDEFYCAPGSLLATITDWCSPWHEHQPWRWYGNAVGGRALLSRQGAADVARDAATPPFLAVSLKHVNDDGAARIVHAAGNPNFVSYAMELYEDGDFVDWFFVQGNPNVYGKFRNSGARYLALPYLPRDAEGLGPAIDRVSFQRYRLTWSTSGGAADRAAVVSAYNTLTAFMAAVDVFSDMTFVKRSLERYSLKAHTPDFAPCATELLRGLSTPHDASSPEDRLAFVTDNANHVLETLTANSACVNLPALAGGQLLSLISKQWQRSILELYAKLTPLGWPLIAFEVANQAGPIFTSYFASGAGRADYHVAWTARQPAKPFVCGVSADEPVDAFVPDAGLRAAISQALGRTAQAPISTSEMACLEHLSAPGVAVSDLTGLDSAVGLKTLDIEASAVRDLAPLAGLTGLQTLALRGRNTHLTGLADLRDLRNLKSLTLSAPAVADISALAGMTSLKTLTLRDTGVVDLGPLATLTSLQAFVLTGDWQSWHRVWLLGEGSAADITIRNFAALSRLSSLTWLHIENKLIGGDLSPLSGLGRLVGLGLNGGGITDIEALSGLRNLQVLNLERNALRDISPVSGLLELRRLDLSDNRVDDVSPLAGLTKLGGSPRNALDLDGNAIVDVSPLVRNAGLGVGDHIWLQYQGMRSSRPAAELRCPSLSQSALLFDLPALSERGAAVYYNVDLQVGNAADVEVGATLEFPVTLAIPLVSDLSVDWCVWESVGCGDVNGTLEIPAGTAAGSIRIRKEAQDHEPLLHLSQAKPRLLTPAGAAGEVSVWIARAYGNVGAIGYECPSR